MKDWSAWARRQHTLNRRDPRIQAIRCGSCNRLRPHPNRNAIACFCGGMEFNRSAVYPDEVPLALKLYGQQIEETNVYGRVAQEVITDFRRKHNERS